MSSIKLLGQAQLGVALTTVYTVPAHPQNAQARINAIWIANTDTATRTVSLRVGSGPLTAANSIGEGWTIPANTTYFLSGSEWALTLSSGMLIQGLADVAGKITVTVSGAESE